MRLSEILRLFGSYSIWTGTVGDASGMADFCCLYQTLGPKNTGFRPSKPGGGRILKLFWEQDLPRVVVTIAAATELGIAGGGQLHTT